MNPLWKGGRLDKLIALGRSGKRWENIGPVVESTAEAARVAFCKYGSADDRRARNAVVRWNKEKQNVEQEVLHSPEVEPFDDNAFSDNVRTRPTGRPPAATDMRFSLTASSFGGWSE